MISASHMIYVGQTYWLNAFFFQTEIAKRLNAIIAQILPFLSQEHQQQVASAVERAKQVTMTELNAIIGVSHITVYHKHHLTSTLNFHKKVGIVE